MEKVITIFTDGSSLGNPGPGGWGAVIVNSVSGEITELGGGKKSTTNNEMELQAVISAFAHLAGTGCNNTVVTVYSDSRYVIQGITEWVHGWVKNGWQTKDKKPVQHKHLWEELYAFSKGCAEKRDCKLVWRHVLGHVGIPGNERVDTIAQMFALGKRIELFHGVAEQYPIHNITDVDESKVGASRSSSKNRGKAYSHLSLIDGVVERHTTWAECEKRVKGKNAKYKKALSPEHEQEILDEWGVSL